MTELLASKQALQPQERDRLADLERVIERGQQTFIEVGNALLEIRKNRLYRETHSSFESYCRERWGMRHQNADRLIRSVEVAEILNPMGFTAPNERQARELVPLLNEPEKLREAWSEASSNGKTTAASVREVVRSKMDVHYSSATDLWSTPQDLFDTLNDEFGFDVDVCATAENAKCPTYYTQADDGLAQDWRGVCWMNPPYGDAIKEWMAKAFSSAHNGTTVVCLVPARVDTGWWWDYARYGEIRFLRGRLKFGGADTSAPFPSAVVIFGEDYAPGVVWWER
jgi:phage N-6-adenine-methyltransferase